MTLNGRQKELSVILVFINYNFLNILAKVNIFLYILYVLYT